MGGSEEDLVRRAVAGEEAALTALLEIHGARVRAALERAYQRRLNGEVELDDVMQVTYLEAFLRIRDFVPAGANSFGAWLRRIAENNIRDAIRKADSGGPLRALGGAASRDDRVRACVEAVARTRTPSRVVGREEAHRILDAALQQLPDDYEQVIRLYDLEGHSGPEVARIIGRSHGAVKMLVARARDRLSDLLGSGSGFFSGQA